MVPLALLLLSLVIAQDIIRVDVPSSLSIIQQVSGSIKYQIPLYYDSQDFLALMTYSSQFPPQIYLSFSQVPTYQNHTWEGRNWGNNTLGLLADIRSSNYYALVSWEGPCTYNLTFMYLNWNWPITEMTVEHLKKDFIYPLYYETYDSDWQKLENLTLTAISYDSSAQMQVIMKCSSDEFEPLKPLRGSEYSCSMVNKREGTRYKMLIMPNSDLDLLVTVQKTGSPLEIPEDTLVKGSTDQSFHYYQAVIPEYLMKSIEWLQVQLTALEGEPTAYLKFGGLPTLTDFYFSTSSSNHTILLQRWHLSRYISIGVHSPNKAVYTLYYSYSVETPKPIFAGVPQSGFSSGRTGNMTSYSIAELDSGKSKYAVLHVKSVTGHTNLFAKLCPLPAGDYCWFNTDIYEYPGRFDVYYSRSLSNDYSVTVPLDPGECSLCKYIIAVISTEPVQPASFTLTANYESEPRQNLLIAGSSVRMTIFQGYFYYQYVSVDPEVNTIEFQITPINGTVSLYSSRRTNQPSQSDYEKKSSIKGAIYKRGVDGTTLSGPYYVSVYTETQATYVLTVRETLSPGAAPTQMHLFKREQGVVYENTEENSEADTKLYSLVESLSPREQATLLLSFRPLTGNFKVCVRTTIDTLSFDSDQWCLRCGSGSKEASVIRISPTDPNYCTDCGYLVYVQGTQFSIDHSAAFTLAFSLEAPIIRLQYDITYSGEVSKDHYKHYSLPLANDDKEVSVSVTPITGDLQLFISISNSEMRPDESNYFISSAVFDTSQFLITRKHMLEFCLSGESHCSCYISISSELPAAYSINATQRAVPSSSDTSKILMIVLIAAGCVAGLIATAVFIYCWKYRRTELSYATEVQDTSRSTITSNALRLESVEMSKQTGNYQPMELPNA